MDLQAGQEMKVRRVPLVQLDPMETKEARELLAPLAPLAPLEIRSRDLLCSTVARLILSTSGRLRR